MSRELFKMNMIASVQKLDNEDIEIIQNYIKTIEQENKQLKERIDNTIEYIKDKLSSLNMNKSAIMRIVEPSNGYLLADVNYEIQKCEKLLEILGEKE